MPPDAEHERTERYLGYLLGAIRSAARKAPQFGTGSDVSPEGFAQLYGNDPFYSWLGLDTDLLYTAHRAAASMTSLYRKLGDGCQELWRAIIRDQFGVDDEMARWDYTIPTDKGPRRRTLDGYIDLLDFPRSRSLTRCARWLPSAQQHLEAKVSLRGVVFEVRQGYKSQDAKRSGGDVDNAGRIVLEGCLPTLVVFSDQIPRPIARRYSSAGWLILRGTTSANPLESTFAFAEQVMGYDLAGLLAGNSARLRAETQRIFAEVVHA